MQKEDGNKNLLRSNTRNQRQQIEPRRDIENRCVRDKIYCKDAIENGGHLFLLPNHSALNAQLHKGAWLPRSFTLSTINFQPIRTRPMETPLTPLEFARRARKLYPERVAVIDGDSHWTYARFLDRCDRWSAALQKLGIKPDDRVAYLSPNTHAQLESFYAVPQTGAVLVPLNYRLTADDFVYLINHSGSRMVCADRDYLATIDSIREQLPKVEQFVALAGEANGWLNYEAMVDASPAEFTRPEIHETD